ncbi:MAG: hypothetical protein K0S20_776, partial [Patescibacteria group bacterium]|nr:hypothetical protein [Patescibacteria group bacterium]
EAFDPYIKQQEEDGHYHEEDYDPEREYQEIVGRLRELLLSREPSPKPARDFLGFTKQVIRDESVPLPDHLKEVAYTYFYFQKAQREAAPYISAKFATDEYCEFVRSAYLAALAGPASLIYMERTH